MGDFEFIEPLRKSKMSRDIIDFQQYIYKADKENGTEVAEQKPKEKVSDNDSDENENLKKRKKKLKRVVHSSSSENEEEDEEESYKSAKKSKKKKKEQKEKKAKKRRITDEDEDSEEDAYDSNEEDENEKKEYETSLNHLFECLLVSLRTKKKLIRVFSSDKPENKDLIAKEFSQGSCRINNCDVNFEDFESQVETFQRLKTYQKCGIVWLHTLYTENKNGILADEMGLGKTAQTCVFLEYMYKTQKLKNKTIVVAPTSLLKNWDHEIDMWCPFLKKHKVIYYGTQAERRDLAYFIFSKKKNLQEENEIHLIITSINMLIGKNDANFFRQIKLYDYLIFDEAHFLKNKKSLIYKQLQTKIFFNYKILLTGSPIQNKTEELTNLLLFLMPDIFKEKNVEHAMKAFIQLYENIVSGKEGMEPLDESIQSYKSLDLHERNCEEEKGYGVILPENTKNIIKDYIIQTIQRDVKYTESRNKEIMLLQLIIEPYILRRSKKHVFVDMPKKHSIIVKLPMNQTQLKLYKHEILSRERHTHKHLEFIQKHASKKELQKLNTILGKKDAKKESKENNNNIELEPSESIGTNEETITTSATTTVSNETIEQINKICDAETKETRAQENAEEVEEEEEETINVENTEENKDANIVINTRDDESELEELEKNAGKETRGKMINALIFILRRICNHPLLHKYYYSVEDIKKISKYFYANTDQYADLDLKTVENEFMKISDFDIHLSIKHLISQGDTNLNKFLISKEHILNSAKIHHMLNLLKEIRKKKEKVLIFSQFTTFLDIIEEALLYEFIYDDDVDVNQVQRTNSVNKEMEHEKEKEKQKETSQNDSEKNEAMEKEKKEETKGEANEKEGEEGEEGEEDVNDEYASSSTYSTSKFSTDGSFKNDVYVRLDGSTHTVDRQKMIKKFAKNDNIFVFLLSTKAGGVGLNLITANHVILMDQDWNPHNDRQAEDRVHRLGQEKEVFIYRLCCTNTIEETILKCCKVKLHLDQAFGGNSELLQSALIKDALSCVE